MHIDLSTNRKRLKKNTEEETVDFIRHVQKKICGLKQAGTPYALESS